MGRREQERNQNKTKGGEFDMYTAEKKKEKDF